MLKLESADAKGMSKKHAVLCVGAVVVAPAWCQATGSRGTVLLPIQGTGHQVMELYTMDNAV